MVLQDWNPIGMLGHVFLHGGFFHLLGNMMFLWVFGNAVSETLGSLKYLLLFLALGVLAGAVHLLLDGNRAIGASGAINGIVGFYLILFPINRVTCGYWIFIRPGTFQISGYWLVFIWFVLDLFGAILRPDGQIAYWAHLGGLFAGLVLGVFYEMRGIAQLAEYDNPSLVDILIRRKGREPVARPRKRTAQEIIADHRAALQEEEGYSELVFDDPVAEPVVVACPHCDAHLEVFETASDQPIECNHCGGLFALEN